MRYCPGSFLHRRDKGNLYGRAWNSLYGDNHDQPRVVSRFGDDGKYRVESAKMLATCLHMMQGTPYIYQGEELGMTNAGFTSIDQYRDIESINAYHEMVDGGIYDEDYVMRCLQYKSRDNARTPMQWNTGLNSIFYYYRDLIRLRKKYEIITEGRYELLLPDSEELYVYIRTYGDQKLLTVCNFTGEEQPYEIPEEFDGGRCLITNYKRDVLKGKVLLKPYEAFVLLVG